MKLYLVRHAETNRNVKWSDIADTDLTRVGKEQARRLGLVFKGLKIDKVYVSKLQRAKDTYKEIKKHIGKVPVTYTEKINEHHMGIFQEDGKDDWIAYANAIKKSGQDGQKYVPKGGESFEQVYQRAGDFWKYLLDNHLKDNILVVGHGQFLQYFIMEALGIPIKEYNIWRLSNASVSEIFTDKNGNVKEFHINDFNHLIEGGMMQ